jgi:hypothetical protein
MHWSRLLIGDRPFVDSTSPTDPDECYNAGYSKYEKDVSLAFLTILEPLLQWQKDRALYVSSGMKSVDVPLQNW